MQIFQSVIELMLITIVVIAGALVVQKVIKAGMMGMSIVFLSLKILLNRIKDAD